MNLWDVAIQAPFLKPFSYLKGPLDLKRGDSVWVPLGRRTVSGVVLGPSKVFSDKKQHKWKNILSVRDDRPRLPENYLKWVEWLSTYYVYPIGDIFKTTFPPLKKSQRKPKTSVLPSDRQQSLKTYDLILTADQKNIVKKINQAMNFQVHLLYGITGSGKTEVYMGLIEKTIQDGKQVVVIVPEISLTPQLIQRFVKKFGQKVAVLHSYLTNREKTNQWWSMVGREKSILIGARSALFCPLKDLGLVVVDEEHEASFKQWERLHYNARDAAVMLAKQSNCPLVLGSATPSLETWHNACCGKYHLHQLSSRFGPATLPQITIEDMTQHTCKDSKLPFWLSSTLYEKMKQHLERSGQVALFLNRRGDAQTVICYHCGACVMCPNCSVSLTLHFKTHLVCHYCNHHENYQLRCRQCHTDSMQNMGIGTAGLQKDLETLFPDQKILRADRDRISSRKDIEAFIEQVAKKEVDILVGTQMIGKGLDFKHLTLVGVISADISLNLPDFRASERTFQLLVQMAGRAGRHGSRGEVVIQSFNHKNPVIQEAIRYQYEDFAHRELAIRKAMFYPPFQRIVLIRAEGENSQNVESALLAIANFAKEQAGKAFPQEKFFQVLGPAPAPLSKLRGQYRYQILIKSSKGWWLSQFCQYLKTHLQSCVETSSTNKLAIVSSLPRPKKGKALKKVQSDQQICFEFPHLTWQESLKKQNQMKGQAPKTKTGAGQQKIQVDFDIDPLQML